jgi:5-methylcytosine-specific restriction endonuclease McrA/DNA-binding transcriptional ArsR family regulator
VSDRRKYGPHAPPGVTRRRIAELREKGFSYSQIARALDLKKSTVAYHARRLGDPANETFAKRYDWAEIQAAYDSGLTVRECSAKFGFSQASWHKAVQRGAVAARPQCLDLDVVFAKGTSRDGRGFRKKRLINEGIKEDRCEECSITHWRGRKLSIQLHHKNGDGTDNRIENLEMLCPNCHSQTDTYGGRNGHRRREPRRPS